MTRSDRSRLAGFLASVMCLVSCGGGGGGGGEGYVPPPGGGTPPPGLAPPPAGTYVRSFGSEGNDHAYALAAMPDGGLAIGGLLERRIPGEDRTAWLGVLDSAGAPVSQQRVTSRDVSLGYEPHTSSVVENRGAVFAGTTWNDQTGFDLVIRFYDVNGAIQWQRNLDSGRWSGNVEIASRGIDDLEPQLFPAYDANGVWQGVWVYSQASSNVVGTNAEGGRQVVHRWSVTLWFLGADGTQVSRTRLVYVDAPARADVIMRSAAVLDNGSLAVLLHEREDNSFEEQPWRRVVRRIGQDGTIGGPTIVMPPTLHEAILVAVPGALIALEDRHVARLDISAQQILWQIERATLSIANFQWFLATRIDRGGVALLAVGGGTNSGSSAMLHLNLATGERVRDCALPQLNRLVSLRGRASGNLRALVAENLALRTVNLSDGCEFIASSETALGESFASRWFETGTPWIYQRKGGLALSRDADFVLETAPKRARQRQAPETAVFDVSLGATIATDSGFYLLTADPAGQVGFASEELIQRRAASGSLVRATNFPGVPWDIASGADGLIWATAELPAGDCSGGIAVLSAAGRIECRRMTGVDFTGWTLSRGPDGSMWAASGEDGRTVRFLTNGSVTGHASMCVLDELDVGPDHTRVSIDLSARRICREGSDGRSWARELQTLGFDGQMEIARDGNVQAVAASDGGVAVMFTVRLLGEVAGVRSTANIVGDSDIALLKLDAAGNPQWLRVFGGGRDEVSEQLVRMTDGGYAMLGTSDSFDAVTPGSIDLFVVRTGPDGHVARTADGSDACQACIGSVSGSALLGLLGERETAVFESSTVTQQVSVTALALTDTEGVTEPVPGETNARQCTGTVTDVQEGGATVTPPAGNPGDAPVARFTVRALYAGATANPVSNRDPARFDASTSTPSASIQRYQWDFEDDGMFDAEGYLQMNTYNTRGAKTARLRVTHANGQTAEATLTFTVDPADGYYVRLRPVHDENIPGNRIERIDGALNCVNLGDGSVSGACFGNGSNAPGIETVLRATPAAGSAFANWVGCDLTRAQPEGAPLCVISNELDGGERLIEAHFVANESATVTVVMTGATAPQGIVHSMDNRLNCPTICSADFSTGTEVELAATWENDGDFIRFDGCDRTEPGLCFVGLGAGGRTITAVYR